LYPSPAHKIPGSSLKPKLPHGHWQTLTFLAALRCDGLTALTAACVIDGPINLSFVAYVAQILVATLKHGDIVIMDNLSSHKGERVWRMIWEAGARLLFLPAYSPDLNTIEQVFTKLKTLLRKAEARTVDILWQAIGRLIPAFRQQECANHFRNAGYASI
jgi:transposase